MLKLKLKHTCSVVCQKDTIVTVDDDQAKQLIELKLAEIAHEETPEEVQEEMKTPKKQG